jgi:DNA mismatch repair protein MutS
MPSKVVECADEILAILVASHADDSLAVEESAGKKGKGGKASPKVKPVQTSPQMGMQLSMFQLEDPVLVQIRDQIRDIDINNLTPLEALTTLNEIKKISGL